MTNLSDAETRAELERIGKRFGKQFFKMNNWRVILKDEFESKKIFYDALRLLAQKHKALREISGLLQHQLDNEEPGDLVTILQLLDALMIIAKNACKEE